MITNAGALAVTAEILEAGDGDARQPHAVHALARQRAEVFGIALRVAQVAAFDHVGHAAQRVAFVLRLGQFRLMIITNGGAMCLALTGVIRMDRAAI